MAAAKAFLVVASDFQETLGCDEGCWDCLDIWLWEVSDDGGLGWV